MLIKIVTYGWNKEEPQSTHFIEANLISHVRIEPLQETLDYLHKHSMGRFQPFPEDGDYVQIYLPGEDAILCMSKHEGVPYLLSLLEASQSEQR